MAFTSTPSSSESVYRSIFIDSEGKPLDVYVCSGIRQQFQLCKVIRRHGGRLVNTVADAQILIADGDETSGKEFAKIWRHEPGKVVLDQEWVFYSEKRGEWPDGETDWGGFGLNAGEPPGKAKKLDKIVGEVTSMPKRSKKRPLEESIPQDRSCTPSQSESPDIPSSSIPALECIVETLPSPKKRTNEPAAIFMHEDGRPSSFYVQVNIKNRMSILSCIRRNGGIITPNLADSDYIILDPSSKQFHFIAQEDRPMFSPDWPKHCEKTGHIDDTEDHRLFPPSLRPSKKLKKQHRP